MMPAWHRPRPPARIYTRCRPARAPGGACTSYWSASTSRASARPPQQLKALVGAVLERHGLPATQWAPAVIAMVDKVLDADLDAGDVRLRGLPARAYLREMEFYFRLRGLSSEGLQEVLVAHDAYAGLGDARSVRLAFAPQQGAVKGFIDLVFTAGGRYYVVDYKSNRLGRTQADYTHARICKAMIAEGYVLQYLVYTVALHRYLRDCLPNYRYAEHFGGVRYLFLRGLETGGRQGVFHHCPQPSLVSALDAYFDSAAAGAQA